MPPRNDRESEMVRHEPDDEGDGHYEKESNYLRINRKF